MRHDPASAAIVIMLRGLKMYGMAQAVGDLMEQGSPAFEAAVPIISQRNRRARGQIGRLPDQGGAFPCLQGSDRIRFYLQ
jgi:hypothetical protein